MKADILKCFLAKVILTNNLGWIWTFHWYSINQHNHAYDLTYDLNYNLGRVEGEAWSEEDKKKDIDIDDKNEHDNVKS